MNDYQKFKLRTKGELKDFCWINEKYKVLFCGIPKNASTSLRGSFLLRENSQYSRMTYKDFLGQISHPEEYFTFTCLRDPIKRLISAYWWLIQGAQGDNPYNNLGSRGIVEIRDQGDRFASFVDTIEKDGFFDLHIRPQIHFLTTESGESIKINKYLFIDSLDADFSHLCSLLETRNHITKEEKLNKAPRENINSSIRPLDLINIVNSNVALLQKIKSLYRQDFILYHKYKNQ